MNSRRRLGILAAALVAVGGGAAAQNASQPAPAPGAAAPAPISSSGSGGAGKAIQSAVTSSLDKFFTGVDATPDQKTQIQGIMMVAVGKILQLKGQFGKPNEDLYALVSAPTVDRGAFEAFRAREMAGVDQVSHILTDAFVDSLAVLTPEQRAKFALKLKPKVHTPTQTPGTAATPGG
jgi:Spy/CpxP family protein refolding chaperone